MHNLSRPFFSVVTPTYNRAPLIGRAVQSVIDQSFGNWELLVIDDASTDGTQAALARFQDARIRVLRHERNMERSGSRNKGIAESRGRYVCFLDSDDYYLPEHLAALRQRIEDLAGSQSAVALSCRRQYSDRSVDVLTASRITPGLSPTEQVIAHHIPVSTVAVPRERLPLPAFDTRFRINEDVCLFAQLAASGLPFRYFDDVTSVWVCEGQNTSGQVEDHVTPQIECMRDLFSRAAIRADTRPSFRRQYMGMLYAQLAHLARERGHVGPVVGAALRAAILLRGNSSARSTIAALVYSLPGGGAARRIRAAMRGKASPGQTNA